MGLLAKLRAKKGDDEPKTGHRDVTEAGGSELIVAPTHTGESVR